MPLPLQWTRALAEKIVGELAPYCERIAIAGSLRRERPVVNDIDLVVLLKEGLDADFRARMQRRCRLKMSGPQCLVADLPLRHPAPAVAGEPGEVKVQIDVWFATGSRRDLLDTSPGNWGSLLLCRTGSKEHNIFLCERARQRGLKWNPHFGLFGPPGWPEVTSSARSVCLASETEDAIFDALDLPVIPASQRER